MFSQHQCLLCKTTLKDVWNSPCLPLEPKRHSSLGENICNHSLIAKHQVTKSIIWKCPLITERSCCKTLSNLYVIFSWFLWFDEILESLDLKTFLMIVIWLMVFYEYLEEKNVMKMQKWFELIVGHPVIIICTGGSSRRHSLDTLC